MSVPEKKRTHVGPYEIGKKIGEGTFGKVKLGRNIFTNEKVAIKILKYKKVKTPAEKKLVEREKAVLSLLNHPNIVKLIKLLDDPERGCCYMVIEYVSGGELFDYIVSHGRLREKDARKFIRQIISALEYCHAQLIIHRDLKPENLLLDDNLDIKITDFGLSNIMSPGKKFTTFCGSLHYACPEILRGEEYVGPGADIWAMGVILYCLVTGSQPWSAPTSEDILQQILVEGLQIPAWLTPECTDLIVQMLRLKEKDRITIAEMKKHPWILKDYGEPPASVLPEYGPVDHVDDFVMQQLTSIGFQDTPEERDQILKGVKTQLVTTYHLLWNRRKEELEAEKKKKREAEEAIARKQAESLAAALAAAELTRNSLVVAQDNDRGRARANSTFTQPYIEGLELDNFAAHNGRERSGSEPPAFFDEALVAQAIAAEAEDELQSMMRQSSPSKSRKGMGKIKIKSLTSSDPGSTSPAGSPTSKKSIPSLALSAVQEEEESEVRRKRKKSTKVSARSPTSSPTDSGSRKVIVSSPNDKEKSKDRDQERLPSDEDEAGDDLQSAGVPSDKSNVTKRPVLRLEDIPKIREAQGNLKPKAKPHNLVSPRRKNEKKTTVTEVFTTAEPSSSSSTGTSPRPEDINPHLFGCVLTTSLSHPDIHKRILGVLEDAKGVSVKSSTSNTFRCTSTDVSFKIEIVAIAKFEHLRGIKISRVTGDLFRYKEVTNKLVSKLKL